MAALGIDWHDRFWVRDEVTGEEYQWGQRTTSASTRAKAVAHILNMPSIPEQSRAPLLHRE